MQIFYVNIGGGEPTVRPDFWELLDYAVDHHVGVKFSTNGFRITPERAAKLAATDYVDVQISLDGATAEVNDHVRGPAPTTPRCGRWRNLQAAGMKDFKMSVVCTRHNIGQLDEFKAIADRYGAQLRLTRLRPSGRGADVWEELHPLPEQQRELYDWLVAHGDSVLTGDSFFHLSAYGDALPGLNLCGAGRVVCLVDPVGDVYACPFAIHDQFLAGNVRSRRAASTGLEALRPVPGAALPADRRRVHEVLGLRLLPGRLHGREVLHRPAARRSRPGVRQGQRRGPPGAGADVASRRPLAHRHGPQRPGAADPADRSGRPDKACDENPLAGLARRTAEDGSSCAGPVRTLGRPSLGLASSAGRGSTEVSAAAAGAGRVGRAARTAPAAGDGRDGRQRGDPRRGRAARRDGRPVLVAPSVDFGASGEHEGFPGTVSIGHEALFLLLVELGPLGLPLGRRGGLRQRARRQHRDADQGRRAAALRGPCGGLDVDAPCPTRTRTPGDTETSLLRFLAPWAVRVDLMPSRATTEPVAELMPRLRADGVRGVSANGVLGDPTTSSAERGRELFERLVGNLVAELTALDVAGNGRLGGARRPSRVRRAGR